MQAWLYSRKWKWKWQPCGTRSKPPLPSTLSCACNCSASALQGKQLEENSTAGLAFWWEPLQRQVSAGCHEAALLPLHRGRL